MASTASDPAVEQLIAFLSPKNVAVYAQTREDWARAILQIVLNRVAERWRAAKIGPHPTLQEATEALHAVVRDANAAQLAIDNRAATQDVQRILNIVNAAAQTQWGRCVAVEKQTEQTPGLKSTHATQKVSQQLGNVQWPESVLGHATLLRQALEKFYDGREALRPDAVVVSLQDLEVLRDSMVQLERNIVRVGGNGVNKTPPMSRTDTGLVKSVKAGPRARLVERSSSTKAMAALKQAPDENQNHTSKTLSPKTTAQNLKPPRLTLTTNFEGAAANRYAGPSLNYTRLAKQPIDPKHDLPRSPGTSPVKKKSRNEPAAQGKQILKASEQSDGAYQFFVLAEREQVKSDINKSTKKGSPGITGQELSNLLATIWSRMIAEEKAPFEAVYQIWQALEPPVLAAGLHNQSGIDDNVRAVVRRRMVEGMKRCRTVLNARTIHQVLQPNRNQSPANSVTRAVVARLSNAAPSPSNRISWDLSLPDPPKGATLQPPNVVPDGLPYPSMQPGFQNGSLPPLQHISPSSAPQQAQDPQRAATLKRDPSLENLLARMKKANAGMKETMARSASPSSYVDLTESDPPSSASPDADENASHEEVVKDVNGEAGGLRGEK